MFTSFLFTPPFGVVDLEQGKLCALGAWDNAATITTPEDIGRLTAEIIFTEPEFTNDAVHLAGDTITYSRFDEIVEAVFAIGRGIW